MVKSGYRSFRPFAPPSGFHHLLSVLVPWTQGLLIQLSIAPDAWVFLGLPYNLTALVFALGGSIWKSWRSRRHIPWIWSFWALCLVGVLAYTVACSMLFAGWSQFFFLTWEKFAFSGLLIIQVLITVFWQGHLTRRARIFFHSRSLNGEELKAKMREYHEDGSFSEYNRQGLSIYLLVSNLVFLGLQILLFDSTRFKPEYLASFLGLSLIAFSITGVYRQEINSMTWGLRWLLEHKVARGFLVLSLVVISLCSGVALAGAYKAVTFFTGTYAAPPVTKALAPIEEKVTEVPPMPDGQPGDLLFYLNRFLRFEWINWKAIGETIMFLAQKILEISPYILLAFVLFPLIRALIKGRFDPRLIRYYWVAVLNQIILWFKSLLFLFSRTKGPDEPAFGLKNSELWLLNHYGQKTKKLKNDHHSYLIQGFVRLLDRGGRIGLKYYPGQTTDEFLNLLSLKIVSLKEQFKSLAELLDRGLFSGQPLSSGEKKLFLTILGEVLRNKDF